MSVEVVEDNPDRVGFGFRQQDFIWYRNSPVVSAVPMRPGVGIPARGSDACVDAIVVENSGVVSLGLAGSCRSGFASTSGNSRVEDSSKHITGCLGLCGSWYTSSTSSMEATKPALTSGCTTLSSAMASSSFFSTFAECPRVIWSPPDPVPQPCLTAAQRPVVRSGALLQARAIRCASPVSAWDVWRGDRPLALSASAPFDTVYSTWRHVTPRLSDAQSS